MNHFGFIVARFALPVLLLAGASMVKADSTKPIAEPSIAALTAEQRCIEEGVRVVKEIESGADSSLNGYIAILPDLKGQVLRAIADPYRCSNLGAKAAPSGQGKA